MSMSMQWRRSRRDDDDDSDDEGLRKRAFYVPDGPLPPPGQPPSSAEEYLRMVRYQARGLAGTVVSDVDPRKFVHKQTAYVPTIARLRCPSCLPELLPTPEWQDKFGSEFAQLRQALIRYATLHPPGTRTVRFPNKKDLTGWQKFLLGSHAQQGQQQGQGQAGADASAAAAAAAAAPSLSSSSPAATTGHLLPAATGPGEEPEEGEVEDEPAAPTLPSSSSSSSSASSSPSSAAAAGPASRKRKQPDPPSTSDPVSLASSPSSSSAPPLAPLLSIVSQMDQIRAHAALNALTEFLEDVEDEEEEAEGGEEGKGGLGLARRRETAERLVSRVFAVWTWVVLAKLDKPIGPAVGSQLRTLYRRLATARATQSEHSALVIYCNMLMTVIDKVFGQRVD